MRLPRSYLYVPGNAADKLARAGSRGADALIVDLEDAVPPAGKAEATAAVVRWLRGPGASAGPQLWVRVNDGALRSGDVEALAGIPALTGIALAKTRDAAEVAEVAALLERLGDHDTLLMPVLETAAAVLDAPAVARQPRVHLLQVGEVDLCADTRIAPGPDESELAWVRGMVVLASAAAGIHPPVGPVARDFRDLEALRRSTQAVLRQGFFGRACIHPAQVEVAHAVFTPSEEEVAAARRLLADFEAAEAAGAGVLLDAAGRMVDLAVVRNARITAASAPR